MSGIDFKGTIVVRCTEKGTKTIKESLKSMKWAGLEFKKAQEKKLNEMGRLRIESGRGTSKIELADMYRTTIPRLDGHYISSRRGTELLKL